MKCNLLLSDHQASVLGIYYACLVVQLSVFLENGCSKALIASLFSCGGYEESFHQIESFLVLLGAPPAAFRLFLPGENLVLLVPCPSRGRKSPRKRFPVPHWGPQHLAPFFSCLWGNFCHNWDNSFLVFINIFKNPKPYLS